MNHPLIDIIKWAKTDFYGDSENEYEIGYIAAQRNVLAILQPYLNDPEWICLEGMTAGELQAYDYGCAGAADFVKDVLDGKRQGGVCHEPWEGIRKRLMALRQLWNRQVG